LHSTVLSFAKNLNRQLRLSPHDYRAAFASRRFFQFDANLFLELADLLKLYISLNGAGAVSRVSWGCRARSGQVSGAILNGTKRRDFTAGTESPGAARFLSVESSSMREPNTVRNSGSSDRSLIEMSFSADCA